jgi:hypothetical protein
LEIFTMQRFILIASIAAATLFLSTVSPVKANEVSINLYANREGAMRFVETFDSEEAAAEAADNLRLIGVGILCIYSNYPGSFNICPSQLSQAPSELKFAGGAGQDVHIRVRRRRTATA